MGKNLQRVKDMLDGSYKRKVQVSGYGEYDKKRDVGDRWTDIEGIEWEQKKGYKVKVSKLPNKGIAEKCSDCNKLIIKSFDKDTYKRMSRCYYCQIDFEVLLRSKKIGNSNNKWFFWVKQQELMRWIATDNEVEQYVFNKYEESKNKIYDESVANALSNANVEDAFKINKKMLRN